MKKEIPKENNVDKQVYQTQFFKGVDYTNTDANVSENRAVYSINMTRDKVGKVCNQSTDSPFKFNIWI